MPSQAKPPVKKEVHHIEHADGFCTIDSRNFPIVTVWWGAITTPKLFDLMWEYRDAELVERAPVMVIMSGINDITELTAVNRKYLADKGKFDPRLQSGEILPIMVVSNPIMRGFLTAVTWMAGDKFPMQFVSTLEAGYTLARKLLQQRDSEVPEVDPTSYKFAKNPKWQQPDIDG